MAAIGRDGTGRSRFPTGWTCPSVRLEPSANGPERPSFAGEVCRAMQRLSAEAAIARNHSRPLVHRQFVRRAARHPFQSCLIDSTLKPS